VIIVEYYSKRKDVLLENETSVQGNVFLKKKSEDNRVETSCTFCGENIKVIKSDFKKYKKHFCNNECKKKWFERQNVVTYCRWCGKELKLQKNQVRKNNYCNLSHKGKFESLNHPVIGQKGENNHMWRGGISFEPYCQLFNDEFKERCREFWGRKCGVCGKTEKENGQKLQVHHINYDKQVCCNSTKPLFIPLCKQCHNKTNINRTGWENILTNFVMVYLNGECYYSR
jgi:hypothetical protein